MAFHALRQPASIEPEPASGDPARSRAVAPAATAAAAGGSDKPLVRPEKEYFAFLVGVLLLGFVLACELDSGKTWKAGPGISAFALIFVMTTAIERLIEIFSPFVGGTKAEDNPDPAEDHGISGRVGKEDLVVARDRAAAAALTAPSEETARAVAFYDELLEQVRANKSTLWALGAALGMVAAGTMGILLLHALGVAVSREVDFVVTGLVIGGGTKAVHELIASVQANKEARKSGG